MIVAGAQRDCDHHLWAAGGTWRRARCFALMFFFVPARALRMVAAGAQHDHNHHPSVWPLVLGDVCAVSFRVFLLVAIRAFRVIAACAQRDNNRLFSHQAV